MASATQTAIPKNKPERKLAPGPKRKALGDQLLPMSRDPLRFLLQIAREYPDIATFKLGPQRVTYLELAREEEVCRAYNISFVSFPINDLGVPDSPEDARTLIATLERGLAEGSNILVHCHGGIGRSGSITSGVLVCSGIEPGEAMRRASAARGFSVPETNEQQQWVWDYADTAATLGH